MGDDELVKKVGRRVVRLADGLVPADVDEFDRARPPSNPQLLALLEELPGVTFTRVFADIPRDQLAELVARAEARNSGYRAPNFLSYWFADLTDGGDAETRDRVLSSKRHDKSALRLLRSASGRVPGVSPSDEEWWPLQTELLDAPGGTGAKHAWDLLRGTAGGDGAGVSFADVEAVLPIAHHGLPMAKIQSIGVSGPVAPGDEDHATAVLGIIVAKDDDAGMVGAAPNTDAVFVVSNFIRGHVNTACAVLKAAQLLSPGDVLLIEYEIAIPVEDADGNSAVLGVPVECDTVTYEAVRHATELGIVVVEAAGNGDGVNVAADLDTIEFEPGVSLNPQSPQYRDSGAILVSASKWDTSDLLAKVNRRLNWAPYGGRIDCYARGKSVTTCRDGNDARDGVATLVCQTFGGTSAAAAIIAGTALQVQGMAKHLGRPLSPHAMREIFRNSANGTAAAPEFPARHIGVMPDLQKIMVEVGIAPPL